MMLAIKTLNRIDHSPRSNSRTGIVPGRDVSYTIHVVAAMNHTSGGGCFTSYEGIGAGDCVAVAFCGLPSARETSSGHYLRQKYSF
jgi:hypothetical protein